MVRAARLVGPLAWALLSGALWGSAARDLKADLVKALAALEEAGIDPAAHDLPSLKAIRALQETPRERTHQEAGGSTYRIERRLLSGPAPAPAPALTPVPAPAPTGPPCQKGLYFVPSAPKGQECKPCAAGLVCDGGPPKLKRGYGAAVRANFSSIDVWRCGLYTYSCYGEGRDLKIMDADGRCDNGTRTGVACFRCAKDHYSIGYECKKCPDNPLPLLALVGGGSFVFARAFYWLISSDGKRANFTFQFGAQLTVVLTFAQTVALYLRMRFKWPELFSTTFAEYLEFGMFDFRHLKLTCVIGDTFQRRFIERAFFPLFIPVVFALLWVLCKISLKLMNLLFKKEETLAEWKCTKWSRNFMRWIVTVNGSRVFNAAGLLISLLFVPVYKVGAAYWEWQENPAGTKTLVQFPDVTIKSDEFLDFTMFVVGISVAGAYGAGMMALVILITICAPSQWPKESFRIRFRFLLDRWRTDRYQWGIPYLMRNVAVCAVTVFTSDLFTQTVALVFVLTLYTVLASTSLPWKEYNNTLADILVNGSLAISLVVALAFGQNPAYSGIIMSTEEWNEYELYYWFMLMGLCGVVGLSFSFGFFTICCKESCAKNSLARAKRKAEALRKAYIKMSEFFSEIYKEDERKKEAFIHMEKLDVNSLQSALILLDRETLEGKLQQEAKKADCTFKSISFNKGQLSTQARNRKKTGEKKDGQDQVHEEEDDGDENSEDWVVPEWIEMERD